MQKITGHEYQHVSCLDFVSSLAPTSFNLKMQQKDTKISNMVIKDEIPFCCPSMRVYKTASTQWR